VPKTLKKTILLTARWSKLFGWDTAEWTTQSCWW